MKAFYKMADRRSAFPHREAVEFIAVGCSETINGCGKYQENS